MKHVSVVARLVQSDCTFKQLITKVLWFPLGMKRDDKHLIHFLSIKFDV